MIPVFRETQFFVQQDNCKPCASFSAIAVKGGIDIVQFSPCLSKVLLQCASIGALDPHNQPEVRTIMSTYQVKKLRLKQVKTPGHSHTSGGGTAFETRSSDPRAQCVLHHTALPHKNIASFSWLSQPVSREKAPISYVGSLGNLPLSPGQWAEIGLSPDTLPLYA